MARSGLCLILSTLCLEISPGWQADPKVATSGQILELECEEKYPIHWCYPRLYDDPCMIKKSPSNIELSYEKENKYKGRLIIQSALYSDTGYYYCVSNETTQCSLQMDNAQRQYVYVQDNSHPLVAVETPCEIEAELQGNAILPCRPTSPNFEMILSRDWTDLTLGRQEDSDMTIEFDHTIGFILRNVTIFAPGYYHCKNALDMELAEINLRVIKQKTNYTMRPRIIAPLHPIVRKGKKLVLKCEALAQERVNFDVTWEMPHKSQPHTTEESCKRENYKCRINSLTIHSVTYDDGGTYTCTIKTQYNSKNHTVKAIKVIGENEVGITLGSDSNGSIFIHVGNNNELKIVVTVTAPENVSLLWYGPKGSPLQSDERKYHIEYKDDRTILKVLDLNLHDAGMYILEASNSYGKMSLNRTVIVQDKPKVSLGQNQVLFPVDSRVNFSCEVWSPKPVDIKWFFKTCDLRKPRDCEGGKDFRLQNSSKVMHDSKKPYDVSNFSLISTQGILRCVANNSFGSGNDSLSLYITDNRHVTETPHVWGEPEDVVMEEDDVLKVVEGDTFTLNCASSVYNNTKHSAWYRNGSTVQNSSALIITYEETKFLYLSNLKFINVTKEQHDVEYLCYENDGARTPQGKLLSVEDPEEAKIIETNLNETIEVKLGLRGLNMSCKSKGKPEPKTLWYRDGKLVVNDTGLELTDRNQSLKIAVMTLDYEGNYRCVVKNRLKEDWKAGKVTITDKGGVSVIMVVFTMVCVVGVIVLVIVLIVKIRKEKKLQEELNLAGLANFEKGALESINPELPVDEQADLLPYDRSWEFPREKLFLGKQLGAGAFGVVMKAEAYGIVDHEEKTTVAVKMVKSGADRSFIKALASELKIMTHLGKHLNVVNLLGASTKNLAKMQLMVIVEFCRYGNLHNYLLRHRDDFLDQLDHTTGKLNLALGMDKLSRAQSAKNKTNLKLRLLSYTSRMTGGSYSGVPSSDPDVPSTPDTTEMSVIGSDMTVVSSPTGEPDECLLSNSSSEQPEWRVKYCSDYKGTTMPVCSQDLFCWAFQVARGMEYLASRKVLHGDLAARNILLADDNIVKICDFGLAKSMYKSDNYRKKSASPLPVKWMALESIGDRVFSTQSDVWSFGIVLWELFSLAQAPYPGMEADENLYLKLVNGYRMEQPPYATNAIYRTMLQSWDASPGKRPSFSELVEQLGAMLDDNLRRHYEELNSPYVDMNERNSHSDYLNMMSAPNYNNIIAPLEVQHEYVNSPRSHSGEDKPTHLNMSSTTVVSPLSTDSVFEFSDEANTSGYLSMMGKEGIFSPGHVEDKPFKFSPQAQKEEATEKKHLNQANLPSLDNYVNMAQKSITQTNFENPSYLMTKPS